MNKVTILSILEVWSAIATLEEFIYESDKFKVRSFLQFYSDSAIVWFTFSQAVYMFQIITVILLWLFQADA